MKKGFTMIELIFVIVILGILAAVAIPKLAATRNDAKAASIKTDIGTAEQAIPAWFQGQKEASFLNAMSIDTNVWTKDATNPSCSYIYTDDVGDKVTMSILAADVNTTTGVVTDKTTLVNCESNASVMGSAPYLNIKLTKTTGTGIVGQLSDMGVTDINISLGGHKVKF